MSFFTVAPSPKRACVIQQSTPKHPGICVGNNHQSLPARSRAYRSTTVPFWWILSGAKADSCCLLLLDPRLSFSALTLAITFLFRPDSTPPS